MEAKEVRELMGAYASVYRQIDEAAPTQPADYLKPKIPAGTKVKVKDTKETKPIDEQNVYGQDPSKSSDPKVREERLKQIRGAEAPKGTGVSPKGYTQLQQSADLFDLIKGHLISEGYADTEEAALKIMANMSEEWKESILDESRGAELRAKHGDTPSKKLETKAFRKAMSYDNRDRLPTGTGTEVRGRYLGLSGRARSRAGGETPASSAVGPRGESRRVRSRGGRPTGIGAGENRDRPTG